MNKKEAFEKLKPIEQEHILQRADTLSDNELHNLLSQIEHLDLSMTQLQRQRILNPEKTAQEPFEPLLSYQKSGSKQGNFQALKEGKIGCLLVAGGQGTRLKNDKPKGLFPITLFKRKSLFQLFAEKVNACSRLVKRILPVAIMTSTQNHDETVQFFADHAFFGLPREYIHFFPQNDLPLLDDHANLFLKEKDTIAMGPDGNGSALKQFYKSNLWHLWKEQGVEFVHYVLIDNPLADPFDPILASHQQEKSVDVIIKCITRQDPQEKVGVLVKKSGKPFVIEYTEMPTTEKLATDSKGELKHPLANISLFSFSMSFIKKMSTIDLPLHLARKASPVLGQSPNGPNCWKFERFIFDAIAFASQIKTLVYPREDCFAPLKSFESIKDVQMALLHKDKQIFQQITGNPPPDFPIELAQDFYYPTKELKSKWFGKTIEKPGYILS